MEAATMEAHELFILYFFVFLPLYLLVIRPLYNLYVRCHNKRVRRYREAQAQQAIEKAHEERMKAKAEKEAEKAQKQINKAQQAARKAADAERKRIEAAKAKEHALQIKKQQAASELDRLTTEREKLLILNDLLNTRLEQAEADKAKAEAMSADNPAIIAKYEKLLKQSIASDTRLYNIDRKIEKLTDIING